MKKVVSILLIIVILVGTLNISTFAYTEHLDDFRYYDKFIEFNHGSPPDVNYNELYYFDNENLDVPIWGLVFAKTTGPMYEHKYGTNVGNRILYTVGADSMCISRHYVYVAELDTFIPIEKLEINKIIELCPDFVKVIEENEFGQLVGDIDENNILDVTDVTYIQRYLAGYSDEIDDYPISYHITVTGSIDVSDFDRNGETTIMDATAIQRYIAGLE